MRFLDSEITSREGIPVVVDNCWGFLFNPALTPALARIEISMGVR